MKKAYIIGICGKTTSSVAFLLREKGYEVSGSDSGSYPPVSTYLNKLKINFFIGYREQNIANFDPDIVVVGGTATKILADNEETKWALKNNKQILTYPEVLQKYIVKDKSVVVTGTYGKGTVSAMLAWILEVANKNPSFMIGGAPKNFSTGVRDTDSTISVIEGDEYPAAIINGIEKSKFFFYNPNYLIINSVMWDHLDVFKTEQDYIANYQDLINTLPTNSVILLNKDGENIDKLVIPDFVQKIYFSGKTPGMWHAQNINFDAGLISFEVVTPDQSVISIQSAFIGLHNVLNAVGAVAMAHELGVNNDDIISAFNSYKHLKSHQELLTDVNGIKIYSDLAHSPIKAKETIKAFKQAFPNNNLFIVFDLHTPSMKDLSIINWFDKVFDGAKKVYIPKVNAIKVNDKIISGKMITEEIKKYFKELVYLPSEQELAKEISRDAKIGDIVVFMSSGDVSSKVELLKEKLNEQRKI